jgi:hypothetical protein
MRTSVFALVMTLCLTSSAPSAAAETVTVTGVVVDLFCYQPETKANAGMDHHRAGSSAAEGRECAYACVKWNGQPVGLLTADGKLFQLSGGVVADNNAKIAPHVSHTVTITGESAEKHGITVLTASDFKMVSK